VPTTPAAGWGSPTLRAGARSSSRGPRPSFGSCIEQDRQGRRISSLEPMVVQ
jgi:hypothetical protein